MSREAFYGSWDRTSEEDLENYKNNLLTKWINENKDTEKLEIYNKELKLIRNFNNKIQKLYKPGSNERIIASWLETYMGKPKELRNFNTFKEYALDGINNLKERNLIKDSDEENNLKEIIESFEGVI